MNATSDEASGNEGRATGNAGEAASRAGCERGQFMVVPVRSDLPQAAIIEQLRQFPDVEVLSVLSPPGTMSPPVAVVRATRQRAQSLRQAYGGAVTIEADEALEAASVAPATFASIEAGASGWRRTVTVQVEGAEQGPLDRAEVLLASRRWMAQGVTDSDGRVAVNLGGVPDGEIELVVRPRAGYWGLWRSQPELPTGVCEVALRALPEVPGPMWNTNAIRFDRLPSEWRGRGVKVALIDSGIAVTHPLLRGIGSGFNATGDDERSWSDDPSGHGTLCAGIIAASTGKVAAAGIGLAQEAELHVCRIGPDPRCSNLIAALDQCIEAGVDIACVGFGCTHGSTIVEQRILAAKQRGIAVIAAAGSTGGPVLYPACSRHVLAVGAIGRAGTFPHDSPHAACAASAAPVGEFFVPAFSNAGPEVDLCAPGVAVISCQSPGGYAARDGTSLAAAHVAALASLVMAHRRDFHRQFASRDAGRVERLFQILKETARPLGDPLRAGAGLADAPCALGIEAQLQHAPIAINFGIEQMRDAVRRAETAGGMRDSMDFEPPRGPAIIAAVPTGSAPAFMAAGVEADVRALRTAMRLAGLSAGR